MKHAHKNTLRRWAGVGAFLLLIACLFLFSGRADSDFGNFAGDHDYGGHGSSSGGGYNSSGRSFSSGGGSSYQGNYEYEGDFDLTPMLGFLGLSSGGEVIAYLFIFFIVIKFISALRQSSRQKRQIRQAQPLQDRAAAPRRDLRPVSDYTRLDPNFDEAKLRAHLSNLYVQMQDCWHKKDIRSLRPWLEDAFYNQMDRQLDAFRKQMRTDYTEHIAVLDVALSGYYQARGMDYLVVRLKTRIVSYVLDDRTGKLVSGDKKREKFMEYEWELLRKTGVLTEEAGGGVQAATCPHCGAPLSVNASAQCEYCGSVITATNKTWAVCSIKGISQVTM